jgi:hypothetical protein
MLKVKFMQYKNVVIMEILEQSMRDYENLSEHPYRALNGFILKCENYPEIINLDKVYLKGSLSENNTTCHDFETVEDAENFITRATAAIKEYNSSIPPTKISEHQFVFATTLAM